MRPQQGCTDVGVGVCVDTRSDSSSFREKPRSPRCHNTDCVSCLSLFLSSSLSLSLSNFSCCLALPLSFSVLEQKCVDWWDHRSYQLKREKGNKKSSVVPPLNHLVSGELRCWISSVCWQFVCWLLNTICTWNPILGAPINIKQLKLIAQQTKTSGSVSGVTCDADKVDRCHFISEIYGI